MANAWIPKDIKDSNVGDLTTGNNQVLGTSRVTAGGARNLKVYVKVTSVVGGLTARLTTAHNSTGAFEQVATSSTITNDYIVIDHTTGLLGSQLEIELDVVTSCTVEGVWILQAD